MYFPPSKHHKSLLCENLIPFEKFENKKQVHCHHCGKEVEIVAALDDTEGSALVQDDASIVKPPADFADSPDGQRQPIQRIYKKLDRRLRSEERGDRRHYRSRQDSARAKVREFSQMVQSLLSNEIRLGEFLEL